LGLSDPAMGGEKKVEAGAWKNSLAYLAHIKRSYKAKKKGQGWIKGGGLKIKMGKTWGEGPEAQTQH